jgi:hypothetical protein
MFQYDGIGGRRPAPLGQATEVGPSAARWKVFIRSPGIYRPLGPQGEPEAPGSADDPKGRH